MKMNSKISLNEIDIQCGIDYDTIGNSAIISFSDSALSKNIYLKNIYQSVLDMAKNKDPIQSVNLGLVISPRAGHKIYNYDGFYDFYFGSNIAVHNCYPKCWEYYKLPTQLSEEEIAIVQNLLWKTRKIMNCVRMQVKDAIQEQIIKLGLELFVDNYENGLYRCIWKSKDNEMCLAIEVNNVENGISPIQITYLGIAS